MGISASNIDLLVAVSGLKQVQDVIAAMRAADAAGQRGRGPLAVEPRFEPRRVIHPEPRYEPRVVLHPTPLYTARPIIHPAPRLERPSCGCDPCPPREACPPPVEQPLEAPWKSVPWKNPPPTAPKVKLAPPHPDISHAGLMMDFFI